ncbi:hypothetical protein GGF40_002943 [Coemansia sp. RSA 1286]|nr:hypothetical protein GGF40_002943 [Coemansia sp. RSA 1286]
MTKFSVAASILACAGMLASLASGHVSIINPCPRYSPVGENCPALPAGQSLDTGENAINGPISSMTLGTKMPLCRHDTPYATPSATWTAGQSVTIKFNPSAAIHSGGNCEFSISYDNGKTFAVIHQELRYCFLGSKPSSLTNTATILSYTFKLPADLPSSDKAVFAWSWVNASGNREFYMNCADVAIKGGSSSSYTGKEMTIANYPGYPTIPEFNGNYDTGMEYYTGAKQITVSPSGSGSYGTSNGTNSSGGYSSQAPVSQAPQPSATYAAGSGPGSGSGSDNSSSNSNSNGAYTAPVSTAPATSAPEATYAASPSPQAHNAEGSPRSTGSSSCTSGALECNGDSYHFCVNGAWSETYRCGSGTVCRTGSYGGIYCDWP